MTIGQAIALAVATGIATYATYDICVAQGNCDRLATDLEHALQQRQARVSSVPHPARDASGLPTVPGAGTACAANPGLTHEGARQALHAAETSLARAEGLARGQVTFLYRGTTVAEAYQLRSMLWTTPYLSDATIYATFRARQTRDTAAIAVYSIPTVLLRGFIGAGQVKLRTGQPVVRFDSRELGFPLSLQRFLLGPVVVPIPLNFTGE